MRLTHALASCLALFVIVLSGPAFAGENLEQAPEGFKPLFNGKSLEGWHGRPHISPYKTEKWSKAKRQRKREQWHKGVQQHWRIEDGVIVNDGKGPFLTTDKEYCDFVLILQYKTVPGADSGIYLRGTPQVQIWDPAKHEGTGSGGLFNNKKHKSTPLKNVDKPFGQWNTYRIKLVDNRATVHFNGELVVDDTVMENYWQRDKKLPDCGPIQLQTHGGEIRFQHLYIKELSSGPAE